MDAGYTYRPRVADRVLREQLEATGAVLVQGAKWCGKTTTAAQLAASTLYMDNPREVRNNLFLAENDPELLLAGETPRLVDEWQLAPQLWDAARYVVSQRGIPGQFIFTGSAVPVDRAKLMHTGTGRFAWLTMRPMSLWESDESVGLVSIADLFADRFQSAATPERTLEEIAFMACRGGWPASLSLKPQAALRQSYNYVDAVCQSDISRVDGINRNAQFAHLLLRSYARHQGGQVAISGIRADLSTNNDTTMSDDTVASYLNALRNIFVIEDMEAWNPNLRSKTAIRTSSTRYFVDPSIATAALGIGPHDMINDLNTFGLIFETMAVRDLRVYAEALDGKVYHYRDSYGLECDAVVHLRNGQYGLVEIKLGGETLIEEGAATLRKLAAKIDTTKMPAPAFLMVLTAVGRYALRRKDGVLVVPISGLKD